MEIAEVIRERRTELGMSQRDLAQAAGVDVRQIRRYEASEQQPLLSVAVAIADALKISVGELAGKPSHRIKLAGHWWASWQTFGSGEEKIAFQQVEIKQEGDLLQVATIRRCGCGRWRAGRMCARSPTTPQGSMVWRSARTGPCLPRPQTTKRCGCGTERQRPVNQLSLRNPDQAPVGTSQFSRAGRRLFKASAGGRMSSVTRHRTLGPAFLQSWWTASSASCPLRGRLEVPGSQPCSFGIIDVWRAAIPNI